MAAVTDRGRRLVAGLAAAALALAVTWMSSRSQLELPDGPWHGRDKLVHGAVWALLAALLTLTARRPSARAAALAIVVAAGFGAIDELHQAFVPGRDASVLDLVADAVGASVGALATAWYSARRWRSSTASAASDPGSPPTSSSPISSR